MSLTSILKTAKLALEMAENAERAAEAVLHAANGGDAAGAGRGCLAAARVSTILARAAADTAGVLLELGCSGGDGGGEVCSNCRRPDHGCEHGSFLTHCHQDMLGLQVRPTGKSFENFGAKRGTVVRWIDDAWINIAWGSQDRLRKYNIKEKNGFRFVLDCGKESKVSTTSSADPEEEEEDVCCNCQQSVCLHGTSVDTVWSCGLLDTLGNIIGRAANDPSVLNNQGLESAF